MEPSPKDQPRVTRCAALFGNGNALQRLDMLLLALCPLFPLRGGDREALDPWWSRSNACLYSMSDTLGVFLGLLVG